MRKNRGREESRKEEIPNEVSRQGEARGILWMRGKWREKDRDTQREKRIKRESDGER